MHSKVRLCDSTTALSKIVFSTFTIIPKYKLLHDWAMRYFNDKQKTYLKTMEVILALSLQERNQ